jgi:threonine dehydrogenase-like Zn-dependent dehydrogenase
MTSTTIPRALWCIAPKLAEIRAAQMGEGVLITSMFSGISRGTERLVFEGSVPSSEHTRMRSPSQEGDFPFPVKYGYSTIGRVAEGEFAGREVFALHPHQTEFRVAAEMLHFVPEGVPAERAVLTANMETALNILWDSGATAGDRIAVIGVGVVGALVGYLAAQLPGVEVTLVDVNATRRLLASALGCHFALPAEAPEECDVVIHASATESGISRALEIAGQEATVVEASWYGGSVVSLPLGESFHSRRLRLVSSQVGNLPATRTPRWSRRRRMTTALGLLRDSALDVLISGESTFTDLPAEYGEILSSPNTLCHRVRFSHTEE